MNRYLWEVKLCITRGDTETLYTKKPVTESNKPCAGDAVNRVKEFYKRGGLKLNITNVNLIATIDDQI